MSEHLDQDRQADLYHIVDGFDGGNRRNTAGTLPHDNRDFLHLSSVAQNGDHTFGFWIIFGIVFREKLQRAPVHHSQARGRVGDDPAGENLDQVCKIAYPDTPDTRGLESMLLQKPGTNNHVTIFPLKDLCHVVEKNRVVLTVPIHLNSNVISIACRVEVAGLNSAANAKVIRQINDMEMIPMADLTGIVGGAVIDNDIVEVWSFLDNIRDSLLDTFAFIISGNDNQIFHL